MITVWLSQLWVEADDKRFEGKRNDDLRKRLHVWPCCMDWLIDHTSASYAWWVQSTFPCWWLALHQRWYQSDWIRCVVILSLALPLSETPSTLGHWPMFSQLTDWLPEWYFIIWTLKVVAMFSCGKYEKCCTIFLLLLRDVGGNIKKSVDCFIFSYSLFRTFPE